MELDLPPILNPIYSILNYQTSLVYISSIIILFLSSSTAQFGGGQILQANQVGASQFGASGGYGTGGQPGGGYGGIIAPMPQCSYDQRCFTGRADCAIARALPFLRNSPVVTCEECIQMCQSKIAADDLYKCRSAVYDHAFQTCDLFAVNGGGNYPLVSYKNRDVFQVLPGCNATNGPDPVDVGLAACPTGQEPRFVSIFDASQDFAGETITVQGSRDECVQYCAQNKGPDGETIACRAFSYSGNQCIFTSEVVEPRGPGVLINAQGTEYLEKFCFPENTIAPCGDVFERWPQYTLVGFANQVLRVESFEECLNECIIAQDTFGINCKSGMFYYVTDPDEDNCILNVESKDGFEQLFTIDDRGDIVDYFEPDCGAINFRNRFRLIKQNKFRSSRRRSLSKSERLAAMKKITTINLGNWIEWGACNLRENTQKRYRLCDEVDVRDCTMEVRECKKYGQRDPSDAAIIRINKDAKERKSKNKGSSSARFERFFPKTTPEPEVIDSQLIKDVLTKHGLSERVNFRDVAILPTPDEMVAAGNLRINECTCLMDDGSSGSGGQGASVGGGSCEMGIKLVKKKDKYELESCKIER